MSFIEMIEPVIDHSLIIANSRGSVGDVAHGLIAALKRIRAAIEDDGGYTMVSTLDGAIRDRLIIRGLRAVRSGEREIPVIMPVPVPGPRALATETIMVAAAETCVIYGADEPTIAGLFYTAFTLVDRLIEALHGAPTCDDLLACLQADDLRHEFVYADDDEPAFASVH